VFTSERGATWAPGRAGAGAKRVLVTEDRVGTGRTLLDSTDVQGGRFELDLLPPQVHKLNVRKLACSAFGDTRRRKRKKAGDDR